MEREFIISALRAALNAGEAILEVYRKPSFEKEYKADMSPVTEADHAAHAIIQRELENTGLPVLSEEGKEIRFEERSRWEKFWLVDPLDGTKEFIKKNGDFTVNIALIRSHQPVLGILYAPLHDIMYFSVPGQGAYRLGSFAGIMRDALAAGFSNTEAAETGPGEDVLDSLLKKAQRLPLQTDRETFTVVASRSHRNMQTNRYIRVLEKSHNRIEIISRGSALKFCLVAEGSADVYPRFGPTWEWDTGAGHAIALEAGCHVTLHDSDDPLVYNKENLLNPYFMVRRG